MPTGKKKSTPSILNWLNRVEWTYAKTMPKFPHWYVNRKKLTEGILDDGFIEAGRFFAKNGYEGNFFRKKLIYYEIGVWKFWTMGWPIDSRQVMLNNQNSSTWILNCAHIDGLGPSMVNPNKGIQYEVIKDEFYNKDWKA